MRLPLPLLSLLLDTPAPAPAAVVHPYLLYAATLAGLLFGVFSFFRRESREDKGAREAELEGRFVDIEQQLAAFVGEETLDKRFSSIESRQSLTATEVANQHNTIHELLRERERLQAVFSGQLTQLQKDVHALEPMPGRVANLEAKFDTLNERIANLKEGLGEVKEGMKENKQEILSAIKQIKS